MHFSTKSIAALCSNKNRNKMMSTLSNTGLLPNQTDQEESPFVLQRALFKFKLPNINIICFSSSISTHCHWVHLTTANNDWSTATTAMQLPRIKIFCYVMLYVHPMYNQSHRWSLSFNKGAIVFTYLSLSLYRTETACFRPTVSSSMAFTESLLILCILCVVHERSAY